MEWPLFLLILFGSILFLMLMGIPVAFSFLAVIIVGAPITWGLGPGMAQVILSLSDSLMNFALLPLPLFILMGEVVFHSNIAPKMIDTLDKWIGRLPGRLSLMAVTGGALFSTLTGTSLASTAMLGGTLIPEMEERGYKKSMSIGPVLGSGGLALMIPPSALAVLLGAIAEVSIGRILIAIVLPGLLLAVLYGGYIIIRCILQPSIAPVYRVESTPLREKIISFIKHILPVGFIIFMVVGVIYAGIATPTEAAATGALGCFIFSFIQGSLTWNVVKKSMTATLRITVMVFMIIAGSQIFSQIMAYSGAVYGLTDFVLGLPTHRILILLAMQIVLLLLGMFMNAQSIMMITLPVFMPVVFALEFDPVWFAVIFLLNMEMASTTPPFGLALFVMKGVAPEGTTMKDICYAAIPFLLLDVVAMALIIIFPQIALWPVQMMG
ncbi:TRAP transporter large permease subunit [Thermodesulfobacteriota bacterium]